MGVGGQRYAPAALPPGKRPGTQRTGGFIVNHTTVPAPERTVRKSQGLALKNLEFIFILF
jgi:hypothetical protein